MVRLNIENLKNDVKMEEKRFIDLKFPIYFIEG